MFRSLADHSQDFIGMCDLKFKPFYVNEAGRRMVGLGSLEEACSVRVQDFFFPEDQRFITEEFFPKVLKEGANNVEIRFRHFKTGATLWMVYSVFQVRDAQGRVSGYATVSRDITERKHAEEAVRSVALFPEQNPFPMLRVDAEGKLLFANAASAELLKEWQWAVGLGVGDGMAQRVRRVLADGKAEEWEAGLGGRTLSFVLMPIKNQGYVNFYGRDVTEQKRAQAELRKSEERYQGLFEDDLTGDFICTAEGRILLCNRAFARIFGFSSAQAAVGTSMADLYPDTQERGPLVERVRLEGKVESFEAWRKRRDGTPVHVVENLVGHFNTQGELFEIKGYIFDDTKRKRAEERLRKELERARLLHRVSTELIQAADVKALYEKILDTAVAVMHSDFASLQMLVCEGKNSGQLRLLGFRGFSEQAAKFWEWVSPGSESACGIALRKRERVFVPDVRECEFMEGSGDLSSYTETGIVAVQTTPLVSRSGELLGMISTHWGKVHEPTEEELRALDVLARQAADLLERKRAETELAGTTALLDSFLATAPLGFCYFDRDLRFVRINERLAEMNGVPAAAHLGKTVGEIVPALERTAREVTERILATGKPVVGHEFSGETPLHPGVTRYWSETWYPLRDGSGAIEGFAVIVEEITARKQAEEAVLQSERRLTLAQKAGGVGVYDWDLVTGEIVWTSQLEKLYGIEASKAGDKQAFWLERVHPDDRQKLVDDTRAWLESTSEERHWEYRFIRPDGHERWLSGHSLAIRDSAGRPLRVIGTNTDITAQKSFQAELERLVAERTAKLHEMVAELEHLSYTLTHDMRAPLRAMRGFGEAIQELCSDNPHPQRDFFLQRMAQAAERMDLLITDALQYAKAVRQEIPMGPVDLGELLRGMLETYPEFIGAGIELEEPVLRVFGNEAALTQCFSNLIGNALKFVRPGENAKVRVWTERRPQEDGHGEGWIRVWVEDQGIGISEQMRSRLFQMFSRASKDYEGTGIGLALVRKVVQRMGGRVGVESEHGRGSRFWVELRPG